MKILRTFKNYTLIENRDIEGGLRFYIDNGEDVSEYFDELEAVYYMNSSDSNFLMGCERLFY